MRAHRIPSITSASALFTALALLLSAGLVLATAERGVTFESPQYQPGSIDGQDGWAGSGGLPINPAIDQGVVTNAGGDADLQAQSWRMSNAYADGAFGTWPFSPSLAEEAGESTAESGGFSSGPRQSRFDIQFDFTSAVPETYQEGLQISTAPDRGDGARMSYLRMEDRADGLAVYFIEYVDREPFGETLGDPRGCGLEDDFVQTDVATGLSRSEVHAVNLTIDFVDGPRNDVVNVYVGETAGVNPDATGGSWEDYFRYCEGNQPRTVDSMIFQARNVAAPALLGGGLLFDNLSYATSTPAPVAQSKDDCKDGGWRNVTAPDGSSFSSQGACVRTFGSGKH